MLLLITIETDNLQSIYKPLAPPLAMVSTKALSGLSTASRKLAIDEESDNKFIIAVFDADLASFIS